MRFSRALNVVDARAEGESGKVVVGGVGPVPGENVFECECADGKVRRVKLVHQPSFVHHKSADLDVPGLGRVSHPESPLIPGITNTVFAGRIDRSPCDTGTTARLTVHGRAVRRRRTQRLRARLNHLLRPAGPRSDRSVPERLRGETSLGAGGLTASGQKPRPGSFDAL
jgi:proline racemase